MTSYYVIFVAFSALGAARAIQQRLPRRTLVAAPVAIALPAAPFVPRHITPDEAAAKARTLFVGDQITVEDYETELDRLIAKGARLR